LDGIKTIQLGGYSSKESLYNSYSREVIFLLTAFIHGFCLALGLILPLGVQNLFVFEQGVIQPVYYKAFPAIVTAALCDTGMILLSVSGVSVLIFHFSLLKTILVSVGIVFLFYMGYVNWHAAVKTDFMEGESFSARKQIVFALSVSLLNPYAFLDIIGVIGTGSLQYEAGSKVMFTLATIIVSWLWFTGLGFAGHWFGMMKNLADKMLWLQKGSSVVIWGTAIYMAATLL
jgi:L-lysine exporter family protein LysE/ArgO